MPVMADVFLDAVRLLTIDGIGFPSDVIAHARCGHEVSLVAGVDENAAHVALAAEHGDGVNPSVRLLDTFFTIEPLIAMDGNLVLDCDSFEEAMQEAQLLIEERNQESERYEVGCAIERARGE